PLFSCALPGASSRKIGISNRNNFPRLRYRKGFEQSGLAHLESIKPPAIREASKFTCAGKTFYSSDKARLPAKITGEFYPMTGRNASRDSRTHSKTLCPISTVLRVDRPGRAK